MSAIDDLLESHPLPGWRIAAWSVALIVASAVGWSHYARLDEVAIAPGEVVPQGQVKTIQHLEGGIVQTIYVAEGQTVSANDPLVQLELGASGINTAELQVQIDGLSLRRLRLEAEASGGRLDFPDALAQRHPDLVRTERAAYTGRARQLESTLIVLREQARQRELEVQELEAKEKGLRTNLEISEQRLTMSEGLLDRDLVSRMEHLQLRSEVEQLRSQLSEIGPSIPKVRAAFAEARERERTETLKFRRDVLEDLGQVELAIARNRELLAVATDQARRTAIVSPIDGVVKNLRFHTIGGVVRPGDPIMEIVPTRENLVVEAKLSPIDVGYVRVGQKAVVKVSTYDFIRYGGLDGEVINIAADSSVDRDGHPFFRVVVKTKQAYLGESADAFPITPGMHATVDIHTGERSVLEYLIVPVLKLKHEAFRER